MEMPGGGKVWVDGCNDLLSARGGGQPCEGNSLSALGCFSSRRRFKVISIGWGGALSSHQGPSSTPTHPHTHTHPLPPPHPT